MHALRQLLRIVMGCGLAVLVSAFPPVGGNAQETGLPIPRFASLKADEVNLRTGPGQNYPIEWVYKRRALPVEITAEFESWRRVRDYQGTEGWVHKSLLSRHRTALIVKNERALRREPDDSSPVLLRAAPNVQVAVLSCDGSWCQVEVQDVEGWVHQKALWGVYDKEVIE